METNSQADYKFQLESQIREAYGRVVYTFTTHEKQIQNLKHKDSRIKTTQLLLSALTTGSFLVSILVDEKISGIIGSVLSCALLFLNAYTKNFDIASEVNHHQKTANALWKVREEYVSLLTDFQLLSIEDIRTKRDDLQERSHIIYNDAPRTNKKSYRQAQQSLKYEEEQTFSEQEIDVMLPNSIRRNKSEGSNQ